MRASRLARSIGEAALRSLLMEAAAAPKPGLVDRENSGAHRDMDIMTFLASAASLAPHLIEFAAIGEDTRGEDRASVFARLRAEGLDAERSMFAATDGVNTHKGAIFSMGLMCGAAGSVGVPARADDICAEAAAICRGVCDGDFARSGESMTKGEAAYARHGVRGVRGEAEDGYPSVRAHALPVYREMCARGASFDDAAVQTLLSLIANVRDTNVIGRHGMEMSERVMDRARRALAVGGMTNDAGRADVRRMDAELSDRRVSPGGCADLLAVTFFLKWAEG